ncbi:TPA: alpha/beta hydrolase [Staphylococcus aureus]|nr:alpha/beta hydrolase [Staphylococcus aureus]
MNKVTINPQIQLTYQIEGKGDPIILLHGLDGNLAGFEDLQHQLASSYKVLTYDLRGHGKSSKSESYDLNDHVEGLKILMEKLNIHEAHILGHDLGGVVAKLFTDKYAYRVKSLTTIASKKDDLIHSFTQLLIQYQDDIAGFNKSEAYILLFSKLFRNQEKTMKWYQKQRIYSIKSEDDSAVAIRSLILHKDEPMYLKKRTCVPTLLINGEHDPLIKDKNHFKLESHFLNVTKKIFEHSGHAPHIEEPEAFLSYYLNFLKSVS